MTDTEALMAGTRSLEIQENVPLAPFTTLGIGGPARWFATAAIEEHVEQAARFASERNIPLFVLGGGSNLLVSDEGFNGLVLHIAVPGTEVQKSDEDSVIRVRAGAGESWDALVQFTVENDLAGIECLAGIPGTTGGTPVQNVGAYGQEVSQTIASVRCFDLHMFRFVDIVNAACGFGYRSSRLNTTERGRYVVTRVDFNLRRHGEPNLTYADLKLRFAEGTRPTLKQTAEAVRAIRRTKGMVADATDPDSCSAGSFFRNPVVSAEALHRIAKAGGVPESAVPRWPAGNQQIKLAAAWLLEKAGFVRGYTLGRAGISSKHTLAIVNRGGATHRDVANLREQIIATVRQRFSVELEQEPVDVS